MEEEPSSTIRLRLQPDLNHTNDMPTQDKKQPLQNPLKNRKTFGRTLGGRVFIVPQTHDMVSTLLSPTQPKKTIDLLILGCLAFDILLYLFLPDPIRTPVLLLLFVFWRASYNFGIGYLLEAQSKYNQLVHWATKYGIFDAKKQPLVYKYIREDIESKIPEEVKNGDYKFDEAPIEYNTWLVFRRLVDLILMNDFVTYVLFAASCAHQPEGEAWYLTSGRWIGGIVLFMFNLWVKLDAHRVVKDYAWYWGDFFYLIDQNLTFDGVFEMAPHPMYSVGYAGYYGISLFTASYLVLFISLLAHAAQFAFLTMVENPHIEKTYNPPPPRRRSNPPSVELGENESVSNSKSGGSVIDDFDQPAADPPLIQTPDPWNSTHFAILLLCFYTTSLTFLTPNTPTIQALFVIHAFAWRLWHTVGIGRILVGQSNDKKYVRHFLKFGETLEDAWRQWKGLYYVSLCMTHASFVAAGWKLYSLPAADDRMALFRHTVGIMLIALQLWTAFSIYDSLGEFGWFFGDFFFDLPRPNLTYSGIYRYLNNPERLIGCAGIWGIVLIASSSPIFLLGLFSHVSALLFINLVERPHMQKLYGSKIRREAGVAKTIRKAIPHPVANHVRMFQGSIEKVVTEAGDFLEEILENARPRLPRAVREVVQDTQARFAPARLAIELLRDKQNKDIPSFDRKQYSLNINNAIRQEGFEVEVGRSLTVPFGEPIRVTWTAPLNHSRKDWIALYRTADNSSREITRIASMGRWVAVCKDQYETTVADIGISSSDVRCGGDREDEYYQGEVVFAREKAFWTNGVYEFRYHHDGKHTVMAISQPFEISLSKVELDNEEVKYGAAQDLVEDRLLPIVQRSFNNDPDLAPEYVDDDFCGLGEEVYSKRIVYAVKEMFGVDFAPSVVKADGNVKRLAWRICNARKVLAPFSMNSGANSRSNSPPGTPKW